MEHFMIMVNGWKSSNLFAMAGGGHIVPVADPFVVGASRILRKWKFQRIPKIYQGFWIKKIFSKILYLGGSGPFVRTFSEIWKIVFSWSMTKFSQQKLIIYKTDYLLFFCFKYNNDWLRIHKLHQCKQLQMTFGK